VIVMQSRLAKISSSIINRLDRSATAQNKRPDPLEECTRFPEFPWDLRTIIIVFPPEAPFKYLNLNTLLGLTGVPFDRKERWKVSDAKDAFDLQFALEAKDKYATYKQYHSIGKELNYRPGDLYIELGERLLFEGNWPKYEIRYRQPEADIELSMQLDSWPDFHWWAYSPQLYCHYTSYCDCRLEWQWGEDSGVIDVPALHDHGWGKNTLPLRLPLRVFRYEVMRLPEDAFAMSLWSEGPGRVELKNVGVIRRDRGESTFMKKYECRVLEWDEFNNYANFPCRVPRRWTGIQSGDNGEFTYEAVRNSEPRAILGEGFLYGFDYEGQLNGVGAGKIEGSGYVEQLGRFPMGKY